MKSFKKIALAIIIFLTLTTSTTVNAAEVAEAIPTIQPTLSCTSTHLKQYLYCVHNMDANKDNELTIFDLVRIKESIVNNSNNIYTVEDLLHLQYVLLNVYPPCLGGAPLMVTPTEEPIEEE